jgi:hypothetical protein
MSRDNIFYIAIVIVAIGAGAGAGWLSAKRRTATLQESLQRLEDTLAALTPEPQDQKEVARWDEERMRLAYQQAADWVKLANNVTWTMTSIYLIGALLALNGSLNQQVINTPWRPWVGLAVVLLSIVWLIVDFVYLLSARSARNVLAATEALWKEHSRFFYGQHHNITAVVGRWTVTILLWLSIWVPAALGLIVAKPLLPAWIADHLFDIM